MSSSGGVQWPIRRVVAVVDAGCLIEKVASVPRPAPHTTGRIDGESLLTIASSMIEQSRRQEYVRTYIYDAMDS